MADLEGSSCPVPAVNADDNSCVDGAQDHGSHKSPEAAEGTSSPLLEDDRSRAGEEAHSVPQLHCEESLGVPTCSDAGTCAQESNLIPAAEVGESASIPSAQSASSDAVVGLHHDTQSALPLQCTEGNQLGHDPESCNTLPSEQLAGVLEDAPLAPAACVQSLAHDQDAQPGASLPVAVTLEAPAPAIQEDCCPPSEPHEADTVSGEAPADGFSGMPPGLSNVTQDMDVADSSLQVVTQASVEPSLECAQEAPDDSILDKQGDHCPQSHSEMPPEDDDSRLEQQGDRCPQSHSEMPPEEDDSRLEQQGDRCPQSRSEMPPEADDSILDQQGDRCPQSRSEMPPEADCSMLDHQGDSCSQSHSEMPQESGASVLPVCGGNDEHDQEPPPGLESPVDVLPSSTSATSMPTGDGALTSEQADDALDPQVPLEVVPELQWQQQQPCHGDAEHSLEGGIGSRVPEELAGLPADQTPALLKEGDMTNQQDVVDAPSHQQVLQEELHQEQACTARPVEDASLRWEMDSDDGLVDEIMREVQPPPCYGDRDEGNSREMLQLDSIDDEDEEHPWERLAETLPDVPPPLQDQNEAEQEAETADALPPRYAGEIKKIGAEYGFISCDETYQLFGRDVYVKRTDLPEGSSWKALQLVSFCLGISEKGHPQARHVETDESKLSLRTCSHPEHLEEEAPPSPESEPRQPETPSSVAASTPSRGLQPPRGESWADVIDELEDAGEPGREPGARRQHQRRRARSGRGPEAPRPEAAGEPRGPRPLRALPLYDTSRRPPGSAGTPSPPRSQSPRRPLPLGPGGSGASAPRRPGAPPAGAADPEVLEAGAAGSTAGTVPLAEAGAWMPALWSGVDVVRALCLRRPRGFLLKVEGELLRLLAAPQGAVLCLPPLAPYYRALLRALCARFGMQDAVAVRGHRRAVSVSAGAQSRAALPLPALVPGTWAGQSPDAWGAAPPPEKPPAPHSGLRIPAACDLAPYAPDAPGVEADGDLSDHAATHGEQEGGQLYLPPGKWRFMDQNCGEVMGDESGFVLTFSVHSAQAGGGVGVALCGDPNAAWEPLQQILSGHSTRYPRAGAEDVYTVLFKPCPMGGNWSVRFGHSEQVCEGLHSSGVPLWKKDPYITFWLATHIDTYGRTRVDVGLDRFPWCRLFGVRLQRTDSAGFSHVALAALGQMQGLTLRGCRVEWGVCHDLASRDHVVHLAWPAGGAAPRVPQSPGLVAVLDGGLAVCESASAARSLCSLASSQGWEARSLAAAPLDSFGARSRLGAGGRAADLVRERAEAVDALGPRAALQLGLHDWSAAAGPWGGEASDWLPSDAAEGARGRELSAAAPSFVPGAGAGARSSTLSADSPEFTPGTGLAAGGLSATAPAFTPTDYAGPEYDGDGGGLYAYGEYMDGYPAEAWQEGYGGGYGDPSEYAVTGLYPGSMRSQLSSAAAVFTPAGSRAARERGNGGRGRRLRPTASEFRPHSEPGAAEGAEAWDQQYDEGVDRPKRTRGKHAQPLAAEAPALEVRASPYTDIRLKEHAEVRPSPYSDIRLKQRQEPKKEDSSLDALTIKAQRPPPGYAHQSSGRGAEAEDEERQRPRRGDRRGWHEGWREGAWEERWEEEGREGGEREEAGWGKDKGGGSSWSKGRGKGDWGEADDGGNDRSRQWSDGWREERWRDDKRWRRGDWDSNRWDRDEWDRDEWSRHSWKNDRWREAEWRPEEGARRPPVRQRAPGEEGARPRMRRREEDSSGSSSSCDSSEESSSEDVRLRPRRTASPRAPRAEPRTRAARPVSSSAPSQPVPSSQEEAGIEDHGSDDDAEKEAPKPGRVLPKANIVDAAAFHRLALGHLLGNRREPRQRRLPEAAASEAAAAEPEAAEQRRGGREEDMPEGAAECPRNGGKCLDGDADGAERMAQDPECTAECPERAAGHPECTAEGPE